MSHENVVLCYEGVQRIYRNAVVSFLRLRMNQFFGKDSEAKLHMAFQKEWDRIKQDALATRNTGQLLNQPFDEFDFLSVSHFFNLFDVYYDALLGSESYLGLDGQKSQKQSLLNWLKTIKSLRDPLSHPVSEDFSREDAFQLLDSARRVLLRLNLDQDANKLQTSLDQLLGENPNRETPREPLEDRLPPRESIVVNFIGRNRELNDLRNWFSDPVSRRWALSGEGGKGKSAIAYNFAVEIKMTAPQPFQTVLWLSAKKRKFQEGEVQSIETPDFSDLNSALDCILSHYGWVEEVMGSIESKRKLALELLKQFPALVVVDDIDSVDLENENVIEFFSLQVPETFSKVLFTSRRTIFGMGPTTTHVSGFDAVDAEKFVLSRCQIMELDQAMFDKNIILKIVKMTEGSPLYIEDLVRLTATVRSVKEAIKLWEQRGGYEARKYALGRECELLSPAARKVLFATTIFQGPISFAEIQALTGIAENYVTSALQELQKLFLATKPKLINGESRFEVNHNTKALVNDVYSSSQEYVRIQSAHKMISEGVPRLSRGDVGAIIRQAFYQMRASRYKEAESSLLAALQKYHNHPDLIGVLGAIYKMWQPPRVVDAREQFYRAWQLKCAKQEMYEYWCKMELKEREWAKAADAADKGLEILPNNRVLLYFLGYSKSRLAKELQGGLHKEKADKEIAEARKFLERSLKKTDELEAREKDLTADIYRALVLVCEMASDIKSIEHYFELWCTEHPDDEDAKTEWYRVSKKYHLQSLRYPKLLLPE